MTNADIKHKQGWELSVFCESKKYMEVVVAALTANGSISFTVEYMGFSHEKPTYLILMWSRWSRSLGDISRELEKIDGQFAG
jgi:hypothetical protein